MSEQVVIVDMSVEMNVFCSDFKGEKGLQSMALPVERVVEYLVKEKFVTMCVFLRPKASSMARNKNVMKSGGRDSLTF